MVFPTLEKGVSPSIVHRHRAFSLPVTDPNSVKKNVWKSEELAAHWTLLPREKDLLANKSGPTRLGFAILLKFFQYEGRFPRQTQEVPAPVVEHVARQVRVPSDEWTRYDWRDRAISRLSTSRRAAR